MPDLSEIEKNEGIEQRFACKLEAYINGEVDRCLDGRRKLTEDTSEENEESAPVFQAMIEDSDNEEVQHYEQIQSWIPHESRKQRRIIVTELMAEELRRYSLRIGVKQTGDDEMNEMVRLR
eukprot:gnl/TRDRNA2_/TRDRNA2_176241_c8_seq6.p1 gnl/TRDRNA2_/TRDRNA2_176241_c8~~gnl/TRDRNA2_/TRDRNA2_176241_c8_seq6.p1  ORF type:complete len:121 (+),score=11.05 gnl/TRDRNA2_/TRDRNA2_176241_c8_seq6:73-435(+)